jgi:hypothetical protein
MYYTCRLMARVRMSIVVRFVYHSEAIRMVRIDTYDSSDRYIWYL